MIYLLEIVQWLSLIKVSVQLSSTEMLWCMGRTFDSLSSNFCYFYQRRSGFSRLYICVMYCHFVLDLPLSSAHCYLTGLFCAIINFRCFETLCDGLYFPPFVSMDYLIGVTFVSGSLQWNFSLILLCAIALWRDIVYKWGRNYPVLFVSC